MLLKKRITSKVPTCHSDDKILDVKTKLLKKIPHFETINYVYVLTKNKKLKGVISIRELFESNEEDYIRNHMITKIIFAHLKTDEEKIANLALENNIKSMPIVDKKHKFLGIISNDHILKILNKEAHEDFMLMSGIIPNETTPETNLSLFQSFLHRTPWIIIGLFGGILAAGLISQFESVLEKEVMLAAFIPLVVYIANAVGIQSQTLYIRKLALSKDIPIIKYGLKQLFIATLIGITCWITILLFTLILGLSKHLGLVVGFSALIAIIFAVLFAIAIPYSFVILKKDPAIGSGPFTTIIQDILSVIIYFVVASIFLL